MSNYPLMASLLGASPLKKKKKPKIVGLYTAKESGAPMRSHRKVQLVEGLGIAGDRYAHLTGSYSAFRRSLREPGAREPGRQLTIVSADGIDAALKAAGLEGALAPRRSYGDFRRNVVVRGLSAEELMAFQGRELRLGDECRVFVHRHCVPCFYNEKLCGREGQVEAIWDASGVSCEVLVGGSLSVSDAVEPAPPGSAGHGTERDLGDQPPGYFERPSRRTAATVADARRAADLALKDLAKTDLAGAIRVERAYAAVGLRFWPKASFESELAAHRRAAVRAGLVVGCIIVAAGAIALL